MKLIKELKDWSKEFGTTSLLAATLIGPGTIASTLMAGSGFGYSLLWLVIPTGVYLAVLTYMTGLITIATGKTTIESLDTYIFKGWGKINAWIQIVGNICAVIFISVTMATTLQFFFPSLSHFILILIMLVITLYFIVLLGRFGLITSILSIFVTALTVLFVINLFFIKIPFDEAIIGLIPKIPAGSQAAITGILGGVVGGLTLLFYPYQVKQAGWTKEKLHIMKWDNIILLGVPFSIISISILLAGASLNTGYPVSDALSAADALKPIAGVASKYIFIIGFFAAVYTTAVVPSFSVGYYLADIFKWKVKNNNKYLIETDIHTDSRFKLTTTLVLIGWLLGPLLADILSPFHMITIAMGVITIATPLVMLCLLYIASSKKIMGDLQVGWFIRTIVAISFIFSCLAVWSFISFLSSL